MTELQTACPSKSCIVGIGNPLLSDDAVGLQVIEELAAYDCLCHTGVILHACPSVGVELVEVLSGCAGAIFVEGVISGTIPSGTCRMIDLGDLDRLPQLRLAWSHGVSLKHIVAMGDKLGYAMPQIVRILAVEVSEQTRFGQPAPHVRDVVPRIVSRIVNDFETGVLFGAGQIPSHTTARSFHDAS